MTIEAFFKACSTHDWFYSFSDDYSVFMRGEEAFDRLKAEALNDPQKTACLHDWQAYMFSGPAYSTERPAMPELSNYQEVINA